MWAGELAPSWTLIRIIQRQAPWIHNLKRIWNKKEGRGKCHLQHRQGTWLSEIQFVDTGTWALRRKVTEKRIFTPSTKSTDQGAPHGSGPAQALLNISVSNPNDRTESTLCKFAASLQTMQDWEERLVRQMAVLPFGGIRAGWRNKPAGNSQRLTGGNAKSYTWGTALQKKAWCPGRQADPEPEGSTPQHWGGHTWSTGPSSSCSRNSL